MRYPILSASSGELSPQIDARSDIDKYRAGCRILENMIPRIYGPATRRPGTKYIDPCGGVARVMPFIYSNTTAYILLLEDRKMYFYYNGGQVLDTWGRRLYIDTPYVAADLFELQYKQSNDVMWIVHPDYAPRKLSRTSANVFSLDTITFTNGPFKSRNDIANDDDISMTPSVTTGTGTLTSSAAYFDAGHVGALYSLIQPRAVISVNGEFTSGESGYVPDSDGMLVEGDFTFSTNGTWTGQVILERKANDTDGWEAYRTWTSKDDNNVLFSATEHDAGIYYRVNCPGTSAPLPSSVILAFVITTVVSGTLRVTLTVNSSTQEGICRVTGFTSSTIVIIETVKDFAEAEATLRWSEGCWSPYRGYPKCITFFESRCVYAGTPHQPQTVWLSATDAFEDFSECTKDSAAFSLTMSSDTRNGIQWISGVESILIGTTGGEWRIWSEDGPLTPSDFMFKQQTMRGCKDIQALPCGDTVLFVDYVGRKLRELSYLRDKWKYVSPDLTALAEHITATGIVGMAFQRNPDPLLWSFLANGTLLSTTYEREQNVIAWSRHPFNRGSAITGAQTIPQYTYPTLQTADGIFASADADDPRLARTLAIADVTDLQNMANDLNGNYYLTQDIDASDTPTWNEGLGFEPIDKFKGTLDGCGYTITNLTIAERTYAGIFKTVDASVQVANLTLEDINYSYIKETDANLKLGGIAGDFSYYAATSACCLYNVHISGTITVISTKRCDVTVGGLAGVLAAYCIDGTYGYVKNCSSSVAISVTTNNGNSMGGFAGDACFVDFYSCRATGNITHVASGVYGWRGWIGGFLGEGCYISLNNCRASGDVIGVEDVGGFIGYDDGDNSYKDCSATGNVTMNQDGGVGGFAGETSMDTTLVRCSAHGNVTVPTSADDDIYGAGGFVGVINGNEIYTDCYAWGNITIGASYIFYTGVGGFAGDVYGTTAQLTNCYSVGVVPSLKTYGYGENGRWGGFIGDNKSTSITSCFWDTEASDIAISDDGIGHITSWMKTQANYMAIGWNFDTIWYGLDDVSTTNYGLGVNSVATIPSTDEDEVWVVVARYIDGSVVRYLEQMQPRDWGDDDEDQWFLDSALDYDSDTAATTFSGLEHLEGEEVGILADGAVRTNQTVTDGSITIGNAASRVIIGLPFRYILKPMRMDLTSANQTTQTAIKNIAEIVVSFYKSGNVEFGVDVDHLFKLKWRTTESLGAEPELYTGDKLLNPEGGFDAEDGFILTGNSPLACTVRAIIPRINVTGK